MYRSSVSANSRLSKLRSRQKSRERTGPSTSMIPVRADHSIQALVSPRGYVTWVTPKKYLCHTLSHRCRCNNMIFAFQSHYMHDTGHRLQVLSRCVFQRFKRNGERKPGQFDDVTHQIGAQIPATKRQCRHTTGSVTSRRQAGPRAI